MKHLNTDSQNSVIDTVINAIDTLNIDILEKLSKEINRNNKSDVIYDLYNNNLLTIERLQLLMNNCSKYFNISSNLIKTLIKNKKVYLLNLIFCHLKFYDNEFILKLLFYYKNKTAVSTSDLNQQISNEKYSILKFVDLDEEYRIKNGNYGETLLFRACRNGNETIVKYLVEHGADINKTNKKRKTPLFYACKNGNEAIVKYLVKHGAEVDRITKYGENLLFDACRSGNETIVKYLVELGVDINHSNKYGENPLFYAYEKKNEAVIKYLVELGANIYPLSLTRRQRRRKAIKERINYL